MNKTIEVRLKDYKRFQVTKYIENKGRRARARAIWQQHKKMTHLIATKHY